MQNGSIYECFVDKKNVPVDFFYESLIISLLYDVEVDAGNKIFARSRA